MASYQYFDCSNQVRNSCSTHTPHGYSKSQMCLFKILRVISSIPPSEHSKQEAHLSLGDDPSGSFLSQGIGVDLNISLCPIAENAEFGCFSENGRSDSSAIEVNKGGEEVEVVGEKSVEVSEVSDTQVQSFEVDNNGVDHEEMRFEEEIDVEKEGEDREGKEGCDGGDMKTVPFEGKRPENNNFLDLLIEAAKLVSGSGSSAKDESKLEEGEPSGERKLSSELRNRRRNEGRGVLELKEPMKKGKQSWVVVDLCNEIDHTSPVVRSKRGRSQALPYRFRDSVVEPLKRSGRPQRPSTTTTTASRKRLIG